jgi:hypothetical protein
MLTFSCFKKVGIYRYLEGYTVGAGAAVGRAASKFLSGEGAASKRSGSATLVFTLDVYRYL